MLGHGEKGSLSSFSLPQLREELPERTSSRAGPREMAGKCRSRPGTFFLGKIDAKTTGVFSLWLFLSTFFFLTYSCFTSPQLFTDSAHFIVYKALHYWKALWHGGYHPRTWSQTVWVGILASRLASCVTLDNLLDSSELFLFYLMYCCDNRVRYRGWRPGDQ